MVLVWSLAFGPVKGEAALHGCSELGDVWSLDKLRTGSVRTDGGW